MTLLEFLFQVDRVLDYSLYNINFDYWSIDKDAKYIMLSMKKTVPQFTGGSVFEVHVIENLFEEIERIWMLDKPVFIPYEYLEVYESISIEFNGAVPYSAFQKYPLMCVRGTCGSCISKPEDRLYCFHEIPCMTGRPDWNCWASKYPNFVDLLSDIVCWIKHCQLKDVLVVYFEFTPYEQSPELDFDYSFALLIQDKSIKVFGNSSDVKRLYEEYNTKYPTEDREIEASISYPKYNFYFKF